MKFLKSLGDGIGTGAGVAWPIFGLVSGSIGTAGLALADIILSSIAGSIFLLLLPAFAYWTHKQQKKENLALAKIQLEEENKLSSQSLDYLLAKLRKIFFENRIKKLKSVDRNLLVSLLQEEIKKDKQKLDLQTLNSIQKNQLICHLTVLQDQMFLKNFIRTLYEKKYAINRRFDLVNKEEVHTAVRARFLPDLSSRFKKVDIFKPRPLPRSTKIQLALFAFAGGFGSIAGCSGGIIGLVNTLAKISVLAAFPCVGWTILGVALLFAVACISIGLSNAAARNKKVQRNEHLLSLNHAYTQMITRENAKTDGRILQQNKLEREFAERKKMEHKPQFTVRTDPSMEEWKDRSHRERQDTKGCISRVRRFFPCKKQPPSPLLESKAMPSP